MRIKRTGKTGKTGKTSNRAITSQDVETKEVRVFGRDLSLSQVHRDTGVSLSHLSRIFGGKRTPSTSLSVEMARYLGVTVDELLVELGRIKEQGGMTPRLPETLAG